MSKFLLFLKHVVGSYLVILFEVQMNASGVSVGIAVPTQIQKLTHFGRYSLNYTQSVGIWYFLCKYGMEKYIR